MAFLLSLPFAALLCRGGVENAKRGDRLRRSLFASMPSGVDTADPAGRQ